MRIGFIGQGWIGRNYADDFERRGFEVVRYGNEPQYCANSMAIATCAVVFIAVPTPTTAAGFDLSIVRNVLPLVREGAVAVIKSTILPGSTELLQNEFPWLTILHSPEFLTEANAAWDAANPVRNIIGTPNESIGHLIAATVVHSILPKAQYSATVPAAAAELIKYAGNCLLYAKVVFTNLLYDIAGKLDLEWQPIADALAADPRLGATHWNPVHQGGRGAGGHCFIKDFAAFVRMYEDHVNDGPGAAMLRSIETKNIGLLCDSGKDSELIAGVYGS